VKHSFLIYLVNFLDLLEKILVFLFSELFLLENCFNPIYFTLELGYLQEENTFYIPTNIHLHRPVVLRFLFAFDSENSELKLITLVKFSRMLILLVTIRDAWKVFI